MDSCVQLDISKSRDIESGLFYLLTVRHSISCWIVACFLRDLLLNHPGYKTHDRLCAVTVPILAGFPP